MAATGDRFESGSLLKSADAVSTFLRSVAKNIIYGLVQIDLTELQQACMIRMRNLLVDAGTMARQ